MANQLWKRELGDPDEWGWIEIELAEGGIIVYIKT